MVRKTMDPSEVSGEVETDRAAHYAQSAQWADLALGELRRSTIGAWALAGVAVAGASLLALALLLSPPSERPVLYAVPVETEVGLPLQSHALTRGDMQADRRLTEWNVTRYVIGREGFSPSSVRRDYTLVARLSSPEVAQEYAASLGRSSPTSPLNRDAPGTITEVQVQSISLLAADTALVRYATRRAGASSGQSDALMAVVTFRYWRGPMRDIDRWDNPLGFQVTKYRTQPA